MAITIQSTPATYSSVHGDLIYTVSEVVHTADPVTYPNYKFIADVYIGSTQVARIKRTPDPVTHIGIFNVGQIVRNYLASTFNPNPLQILAQTMSNGEFSVDVTVKFGEEYAYTAYYTLVSDSARKFYNNYNSRGFTSSLADKIDEPVTDRPYQTPVKRDAANNFVPFVPSTTGNVTVRIKTYNFSGVLDRALNYTMAPAAANELMLINLAPLAINPANPPDMINGSIGYYTVQFDGAGTDITYRFDLVCEPIYETFTLHFLNRYGGFESKSFTKVSRKTIDIEKKDFGKLPYTVDSSGVVSYKNANGVYNESRSVYSSQYKEKLTLNSDLLTDDEYVWLEQLVLSVMVYIEDSGTFYPCVITGTNYERKKFVNDELTNLTVSIEYGVQLNTQFR